MAGMKIRPVKVIRNTVFVPLTKGYEAIIDLSDLPEIGRYNWRALVTPRSVYAIRSDYSGGGTKTVLMHRCIAAPPDGFEVDHIDSNGLNNRRYNLRLATRGENNWNARRAKNNKSGFKGVVWHPKSSRWRAVIKTNGAQRTIGYFQTPEEAHFAYCKAAFAERGEFARVA